MKLQLKCDGCTKVGTPEEISTDHDGRDLCKRCRICFDIGDLEQYKVGCEAAFKRANTELNTVTKKLEDLRGQLLALDSGAVLCPPMESVIDSPRCGDGEQPVFLDPI